MNGDRQARLRNGLFLVFNLLVLVLYYAPMGHLFIASLGNELYSHIILIPLVSAYLIFLKRKVLFSDISYAFIPGMILIVLGGILYLVGTTQENQLNQSDYLSLMIFSAILLWIGGFVLFYGVRTFQKASFPLFFLAFIIPIPTFIVDTIIFLLQNASAEVSYYFFQLSGVPVLREGLIFHFPNISIEVAKECSGIRSTIALFICSVLAGHFFLETGWKKLVLCLLVFPITVIKNGLRIVTLTLLANYVDTSWLTDSFLHKNGGVFFFILALLLFAPILKWLKKTERELSPLTSDPYPLPPTP